MLEMNLNSVEKKAVWKSIKLFTELYPSYPQFYPQSIEM
jgi:hypothetical protein